jgi:hypothetical protein
VSIDSEPFYPETAEDFERLFSVAEAALREVGLGDRYEVVATATGLPWVKPDATDTPDEPMVNRAFALAWEAAERSARTTPTQSKERPDG